MIVSMLGRIIRALAALAVVGFLTPALAQQPPTAAQQPSTNAILLAREIIFAKGGNRIYEPVIAEVIDRAKGVLVQTNPMLSRDLNEVAAKVRSDSAPRVGEILSEVAKMYAARFTERELKDALAFYKSPLGQKIIVQEPAILDASVAFAQDWVSRFSEQVLAQMRNEMKKRGHDL
jgi:uncharacterized protein